MTILAILWSNLSATDLSNMVIPPLFYPLFMHLSFAVPDIVSLISWEAVYLVATAIIGLLIAYEAWALKKNAGKLPTTFLFNISSIIETLWMVITGAFLYFGHFSTLPKVIAVAYIIYGVFGWLYSFYLLKDQDLVTHDIENIKMPAKFMDYSFSFSWVIIIASLGFLFILFEQGKISLGT